MAKKKPKSEDVTKVKISKFVLPEFQLALAELMNSNSLPVGTSWELLQLCDRVIAYQKQYEGLRLRLVAKYGKKDDTGKLQTNTSKTEFLLDDKDSFSREYADLMNLEVEIKRIPLSAVKDIKLSAAKLRSLVETVIDPAL